MDNIGMTKLILFDGECMLCNKSVQLIINNDPNKLFKFASLQSPFGKSMLTKIGADSTTLNSIVLIEDTTYYIKSTAVLKIMKELKGYAAWYRILKLFPSSFLDALYNITARIRYKLFGKTEYCEIYERSAFHNRIMGLSKED